MPLHTKPPLGVLRNQRNAVCYVIFIWVIHVKAGRKEIVPCVLVRYWHWVASLNNIAKLVYIVGGYFRRFRAANNVVHASRYRQQTVGFNAYVEAVSLKYGNQISIKLQCWLATAQAYAATAIAKLPAMRHYFLCGHFHITAVVGVAKAAMQVTAAKAHKYLWCSYTCALALYAKEDFVNFV